MSSAVLILALTVAGGHGEPARAEPVLPLVELAETKKLREHCERLLQFLESQKASFPTETTRHLRTLLRSKDTSPADFSERVQKLLDPCCLAAVDINPESRVKATRGPAAAQLVLRQERLFLIKVVNEAGVTHGLAVGSLQASSQGHIDGKHWLQATIQSDPPLGKTLTGEKLEYAALRLTAREEGRREANLKFDVGQGTQDLGFRAELPILFTVRPVER